jgi:uncharacterized membrane protein (UPF0182 family)
MIRIPRSSAPNNARRRVFILTVGAAALVAVLLGIVSTFYTEVLWFREVGYSQVFWSVVWTRLALGAVFGVVFAAVVLLNLWIARKITNPARLFTVPDPIFERYRATLQPYTKWLVIVGALVLGLFAGGSASARWRDYLLFNHATKFGSTDPIFHKDLGFYVFRLPFHQFLLGWVLSALVVVTLISAAAHYFMGGIRPQARGERVAPEVRAHLSVLLGLIVASKAWGYRLGGFNLLYSPRGVVTGASYADVHAQQPALNLLVFIALLCAVLFLINVRFKNWILPIGGLGLLALTSIIGGGIYPTAIQKFSVKPNERKLEQPYIQRNIDATRAAYDVSDVDVIAYPGTAQLTPASVRANQDTIQNIRLWRPEVLLNSYTNLQRIKQYYKFLDVDVDRYDFASGRRQVMLAAREISPNDVSTEAKTWLNTHLFYTHGYGVVASRVDRITGQGTPDFILQNIPPQVSDGGPSIKEPQIYYGENEEFPFVVVNSNQKELDYPTGDQGYKDTHYSGTGGIKIGNFLRRAAFAWRFRDVNLLISGAISNDSKIMFRRLIADRVQRVAPFLKLDGDPYIAVADGKLVWIQDAYTTTNAYPYSQRTDYGNVSGGTVTGGGNYIRNSVKFVVDARNGTVDGYVWDDKDPILQAWMKVFPHIFKQKSEMSPAVLAHVRYPEGLFKIQSWVYANYHQKDADTFYQKEDAWLVGNDPTYSLNFSASANPPVDPYYVLMALPGEKTPSFVLVRPFTPGGAGRQNMTAYMVARCDPDKYGQLLAYSFPRSDSIYGPELAQGAINQDPDVSSQVTLWNQEHSKVIYGNLLIVPLANSLLYVQPLYLQGSGSQIPQLKRVVVLSGADVEMGTSLEDALAKLFGQSTSTTTPSAPADSVKQAIADALAADQAAQACLKAGDFACYGRNQAKERTALNRAAQLSGAQTSPSPSPAPKSGA